MELFFELEIVYIVIGAFLLGVTFYVTTRDFMPKVAFKRGMLGVGAFVLIIIGLHYSMTTARMKGVEKLFNEGETIICENKMRRTVSRSVLLSKKMGWRLEGHLFKNDEYERDFHTSRCIEYDGVVPEQMKEIFKRYAVALFFLFLVVALMLFGTLGVMSLGDEMAHEMGVDMKPKGERLLK